MKVWVLNWANGPLEVKPEDARIAILARIAYDEVDLTYGDPIIGEEYINIDDYLTATLVEVT